MSINNVDGLIIKDCHVEGNRHDVPVNGMLSAARFIRYAYADPLCCSALLKTIGYDSLTLARMAELLDRMERF